MTIEQIAKLAHEANRAYCQTIGDDSQVSWSEAPEWQRASAIKGAQGVLSGELKSAEDTHEAWSRDKYADGWCWGPVKDADKKEHPCLVPYSALPRNQKVKDAIFFAVVRGAAIG